MTTPTNTPTPSNDRMTAAEIRELFEGLNSTISALMFRVTDLEAEIHAMREGLTIAATRPAQEITSNGENFTAVKIEREKRKGIYYYKMLGGRYTKHGVTIWPEVLEALGLDKVEFSADDTYKLDPPLEVHATAEYYTDPDDGQQKARRKVTGRA